MLFVRLKLWLKKFIPRNGLVWNITRDLYTKLNELRRVKGSLGILPDFIICGAQKGGTTSLYHYLIQHPHIHGATTKEIHYFDQSFDEDESWYRSHFPLRLLRSISEGSGLPYLSGEASPYYMFHPLVPKRIYDLLPDVKLIFLVRDPVRRTLSHYNHSVSKGFENRDFETAIKSKESVMQGHHESFLRRRPEDHLRHSYVARSRYSEQLKRFMRFFEEEQLLVMRSETLFQEPERATEKIHDFLGVRLVELEEYHEMNKRDYSIEMSEEALNWLEDHFESYNEELKEMTGIDFNAVTHTPNK